MADDFEAHVHDVLVVGAGGAGLRAAIEARARGASVGLVCKSLLGKAHTVMAEGGAAAALAHVAPDDNWKVHFRDTMVGGKLLNHPRMAQLHALEAPDRIRELELWGAVFDRTADGRISQRSEEHTSELQSQSNLVCRLLLEKKKPARDSGSVCHRTHKRNEAFGQPGT